MKRLVIAIDGFSSCGKSTMAKNLAKRLGYIYIDSGAMYRAVTLYCLQNELVADGKVLEQELKLRMPMVNISFKTDAEGHSQTFLNGANVETAIRSLVVSNAVSLVSAIPFVRDALVALQREAGRDGGVVMDGRDIGTVVFPQADLKLFLTAEAEIRARRRYDELMQKGTPESLESIIQNIKMRDRMDQTRAVSPLKKADDAIVFDNSYFTPQEQDDWLINQVKIKEDGHC